MTLSMLDLEKAALGSRFPLDPVLNALPWNSDGLIAAIAQQHGTGEVLMLAWMNRQALDETLSTGQVCYWSRSRQQLWRKGESSGHWQQLIEARLDCDGDAVLLIVDQQGPACHTDRPTCFYNAIDGNYVHIITEPAA
ncbi:phosphoribosyl-AMP cyclohydrolase [Pseudomonas poae]|uniref:Phosphoribosyl-AMP cyclohydrolase n=1 Tax=Pseudomonas poae TaxID=200451 RepID=A0A423F0X1_9PSED|nr:phosphoribosyl-AMP cyclohydrolase [Pseudomonas poae]ROM47966.1 phosphoribosyl-AMP cyclohydrolase [Pseudomonas poae]